MATVTNRLREAMEKIYHEIRSYCFDYGAGESHESLVDRTVEDPPDYTCYRDSILEIDSIVEAALALPLRNCDLDEVAENPEAAWLNDEDNWDEWGSPKLCIEKWLLAPAKKGGEDE